MFLDIISFQITNQVADIGLAWTSIAHFGVLLHTYLHLSLINPQEVPFRRHPHLWINYQWILFTFTSFNCFMFMFGWFLFHLQHSYSCWMLIIAFKYNNYNQCIGTFHLSANHTISTIHFLVAYLSILI